MARTTATDVKLILDSCTLPDATVDAYISTANLVVNQVFENDSTLGTALLTDIEKWFTAHMISSTTWRSVDTEKLGDASVKYTGQWGKGLDSTPYGQMVKTLDVTGKFAATGKRVASIYAITSFE